MTASMVLTSGYPQHRRREPAPTAAPHRGLLRPALNDVALRRGRLPPRSASGRGRASPTSRSRPFSSFPVRSFTADWASVLAGISTNANPLGSPLNLSVRTDERRETTPKHREVGVAIETSFPVRRLEDIKPLLRNSLSSYDIWGRGARLARRTRRRGRKCAPTMLNPRIKTPCQAL
jgi:hypothetical protein